MTTPEQIAAVAGKLTKAQRELVLASKRGGWGRDDTACGVPIRGQQYRVARALERLGLGDHSFGSEIEDLYFNNQLGLAVRDHLKKEMGE